MVPNFEVYKLLKHLVIVKNNELCLLVSLNRFETEVGNLYTFSLAPSILYGNSTKAPFHWF